ncbi:hypothetical protein GCM10027614_33350 [Micromonospora vulcania]
MVGDPVVVCGRLYTRDWTDDAGNHRTLYELEAVAVGHDLSRGRARFLRNRPSMTTSTVEDAEAEGRVHGEPTEPVPVGQAPVLPDDHPLDDDFELPVFDGPPAGPYGSGDGMSFGGGGQSGNADDRAALDDDELAFTPRADVDEVDELDDELGPVPDEGQPDEGQPEAEPEPAGRGRRGRGRVPQPA